MRLDNSYELFDCTENEDRCTGATGLLVLVRLCLYSKG